MNNEYILKHIEKDRPFKTEKECIEYYMDECWVKQDVASDLFYYKVIIDKAIEYIENDMPYLEEPDEEFERCDGTTYMTMKEYDTSVLLDILRGDSNE